MKKLLFAVSALAALSLLAPSTGFAQVTENVIGIYTNETGDLTDQETAVNFTGTGQFTAYLVLNNPVNQAWMGSNPPTVRPMDSVSGFECNIATPTDAQFFTLAADLPGGGLNVGQEPGDWIVGFSTPAPVTEDKSVVLITFTFMTLDTVAKTIFLGPTIQPSFPGEDVMAIVDGSLVDDNLQRAYPITGDFDLPVFGINTDPPTTPIESESWGGVKALFR